MDPGLVASVIPPPPAGSPPPTVTVHHHPPTTTATSPDAPLPPAIISDSRGSSVERLSGPQLPRRLVPQTPEPEGKDSDFDEDGDSAGMDHEHEVSEEDEVGEEAGSELTHSALFVPPPVGQGQGVTMGYRTVMDASEGEESEPPLRVPPPVTVSARRHEGGAYDDTDEESNASGVPLPVRVNLGSGSGGGESGVQGVVRPSRGVPPPPPPPPVVSAPNASEGEDSGSDYGDEEQQGGEDERILRTRPLSDELLDEGGVPLIVPPQLGEGGGVKHAPIRSVPPPPPPPEEEEKEVLGEDEGGVYAHIIL